MIPVGAAIAFLVCAQAVSVPDFEKPVAVKGAKVEAKARGNHQRIVIKGGPVHLFRPVGYDRRTAGIVVYVHGFYVHADDAWREHKLGAQFVASRRNALFIVPEAPAGPDEVSSWMNLRRLITTALRRAGLTAPRGPVIVVGHSGAYRTIVPWLDDGLFHNLILVDALYGYEAEFRAWLDRKPNNRMTLVVKGTAKWADPFVRALPYAVTARRIPDTIDELPDEQRDAKVLALRSQYGHFELITEGNVLPVLLRRTPLPAIRRASTRGK